MHLANIQNWFWVILFVISGIFFILLAFYRKTALLKQLFQGKQRQEFSSDYNPFFRMMRQLFLIVSILIIGFVLMDPRWGSKDTSVEMEGIDMVIVMDISRSMETPDVQPNRLEKAKLYSYQLITQMLGNRVGLAAFAGYGFKVIPLTTDIQAALNFLEELNTDMIDVQGSNIEDALKNAGELFEKDTLTHKVVILFSDGEDIENSPMKEVNKLKENGIVLFTVGIGTRNGGTIPLLNQQGEVIDTLKDDKGKEVISQLNEELLTGMAEKTGGFYIYGDTSSLNTLVQRLNKIKKSPFGTNVFEVMEPQYQLFLLMAVLLMLTYFLFPEKKSWGKTAAAFLFLTLLNLSSCALPLNEAKHLFHEKQYQQALQIYQKQIVQDPYNERLLFNEGNCYLMLSNFQQEVYSFVRLTNSPELAVKLASKYQLGQAYFLGKEYENSLINHKWLLDHLDPKSSLFGYARDTFVFIKQMQKQNQNQSQTNQNKDQNQSENNDQKDKKNNQNQDQDKNQDKQQDKQQSQSAQQQQPVQPSDVENLLNLIEQEEKKHLSQKDKPKGNFVPNQQKW